MKNYPSHTGLRLALVLAMALGGLMSSEATAAWTVGKPIVTYWDGQTLDASTASLMANGNFNVTWARLYGAVDTLDAQLALCNSNGLRAILRYDNLITPASLDGGEQQAKLDALIDRFKVNPAAYMYFIGDEPSASEFTTLAPLVEYIHQRDPDHAAYINLYADYFVGIGNSYNAYLNSFINTVHPEILSYDHYSFLASSDKSWRSTTNYYYQNLAEMRAKAAANGMPFMNIVQAVNWADGVAPWRNPDAAELRLQAYTTMAYGASGISYFTYANWTQGASDTTDKGGIVQRATGLPTQTYYDLIPINRDFTAIVSELQEQTSLGAFHKGDQPPGTTRLPSDSPFYLSPDVVNTTYTAGQPVKGWVLGLFGEGTTVLDATSALVVNLDHESSHSTTVYGPGNLFVFDTVTGHWTNQHANHVTLNFAAGGGWLISTVPEPATLVLLGTGLVGMAIFARRRKA